MAPFYCPHCWKLIPDDAQVCAFCLASLDWNDPFLVKGLLDALRGAESARAAFAAQLIGRYRIASAIPSMLQLVAEPLDPKTKHAILSALGSLIHEA
jgi:hypothetical protein